MKVLLIGVYAEESLIGPLNARSRPDAQLSIAAIKYTRLIHEGFRQHLGEDCTSVALVPVGMYPASRLLWWRPRHLGGWHYLPFINVLILKQITIALALAWHVARWARATRGTERCVVFACIYLPFLAPFLLLKRAFGLRLVSFVPDLPDYAFTYEATVRSVKQMLVPLYVRITRAICGLIDRFVFITEDMRRKFGPRPYLVIEGFADPSNTPAVRPATAQPRAIMYSGALLEKFGIGTLLEAFSSMPGDHELWLFGSGEMERPARAAAAADPRIKVFGNVPNAEVLVQQRRATLLVNPRPTAHEFTRYSFPSKIMEYMSSGTPVLTTRLAGIPADYHDKLWFIDDESVAGVRDALRTRLATPDAEAQAFGRRAAAYVLDEKTNVKRIGTLLQWLRAPDAGPAHE